MSQHGIRAAETAYRQGDGIGVGIDCGGLLYFPLTGSGIPQGQFQVVFVIAAGELSRIVGNGDRNSRGESGTVGSESAAPWTG